MCVENTLENAIRSGCVFFSIWARFWTLWGPFWSLLGGSWGLLGASLQPNSMQDALERHLQRKKVAEDAQASAK